MNALHDADGDGVCDEDELGGCTDVTACNYSTVVTEDDGSCEYCSCYDPEIISGPDTLYFDSDSTGYGAKLVRVMQHSGGDLDGKTTYRLFVTTASPDDKLSSVFGNGQLPAQLEHEYVLAPGAGGFQLWVIHQHPALRCNSILGLRQLGDRGH